MLHYVEDRMKPNGIIHQVESEDSKDWGRPEDMA